MRLGCYLLIVAVLCMTGCGRREYVCTGAGLAGEYLMIHENKRYTVDLVDDSRGRFMSPSATPSELKWIFVSKHNFVELDLPTRSVDVLRALMGVSRPPDVIVTDRGVVALRPICDSSGRAERLVAGEDGGLQFLRQNYR